MTRKRYRHAALVLIFGGQVLLVVGLQLAKAPEELVDIEVLAGAGHDDVWIAAQRGVMPLEGGRCSSLKIEGFQHTRALRCTGDDVWLVRTNGLFHHRRTRR